MLYPDFIEKWFVDINTVSIDDDIFDKYPEVFEELRSKKETIYYLFNFTKILNTPQQIFNIIQESASNSHLMFILFYIKLIYKLYFPEEYNKAVVILQKVYEECEDCVYRFKPDILIYNILVSEILEMLDMTYYNMLDADNITFNDIFIDTINSEILSTYLQYVTETSTSTTSINKTFLFISKLQICLYNIFFQLLKRM